MSEGLQVPKAQFVQRTLKPSLGGHLEALMTER